MRRIGSLVLIVLGAVLMLAATERFSGAVLIGLGLAIEIVAHLLERRGGRR